NGRHGRFGAAVNETDFFDRRHPIANKLRELDFEWIGNSETQSARRDISHKIDNYIRRVTENGRAPAPDVIDVFIPIDVPDARAFCAIDEEWFAADVAKRADGRVHAAGNYLLRSGEKF
ncbi:MAG: hypothetical protein QOG48_2535, partial [Verrucomicrobiota bacterium]